MLSIVTHARRYPINNTIILSQGFFSFLKSPKPEIANFAVPFLFNYNDSLMAIYDHRSFSLKQPIIKWININIEAEKITPASLGKKDNEPLAWYYQYLAKYHLTLGNLDAALDYAKQSLCEEKNPRAYRLCGIIYLELNDSQNAERMFQCAVKYCNEKRIDSYFERLDLSIAQCCVGDLSAATKTLSTLIKITPNLGQVPVYNLYSLRGIFYALQKENDLAKSDMSYIYKNIQIPRDSSNYDKKIFHYNLSLINAICESDLKKKQEEFIAISHEAENTFGIKIKNESLYCPAL